MMLARHDEHAFFNIKICILAALPLLVALNLQAQSSNNGKNSVLLIQCDRACTLYVDGDAIGSLNDSGIKKLAVVPGQHLVKATGPNKEIWNQTVTVPAGNQSVVDIAFSTDSAPNGQKSTSDNDRQQAASSNAKPSVSPLSGIWTFRRDTTSNVSVGRGVVCPVTDSHDILLSISDDGKTSLTFDEIMDASGHRMPDACYDNDNPRIHREIMISSEEVKLSPVSSSDVSFVIQDAEECTGCDGKAVKGRISKTNDQTASISFDAPNLGTYELTIDPESKR